LERLEANRLAAQVHAALIKNPRREFARQSEPNQSSACAA